MSVFVLNDTNREINSEALKQLGVKKGLDNFVKKKLGTFDLFILHNSRKSHYSYQELKNELYSFGSIVYKNKSYTEALKLLLNDFKSNHIDQNSLFGSFILILKLGSEIKIIRDKSYVLNVFKISDELIYSNSFLALTFPIRKKWSFNNQSIKENIMLGYIISPKTIINEIVEVDYKTDASIITFENFILRRANKENGDLIKEKVRDELVKSLRYQYSSIAKGFKNDIADIGISGGYDSRLNMALANEVFNIQPHSHFKEVADQDLTIAKNLSEKLNLQLKTKKINPAIDMTEASEIEDLINDSFYYYDGRVAVNTGFFNEIYTRNYREFILEDSNLTLTGFGGEIFRNFDFQPTGNLDVDIWMKNFVFSYFKYEALSDSEENKRFYNNIKRDILLKLNIDDHDKIHFNDRRAYFSDIWLPMTYSIKAFAENQLSYFISPFIDASMHKMTPTINALLVDDWNLQSKLICDVSENLAGEISSYGYSFTESPKIYGFAQKLKNRTSVIKVKNMLQRRNFAKAINSYQVKRNDTLEEIFNEVLEFIEDIDVKYIKSSINWYYNVLSVALIIKKIKNHNESI